MNFVTAAGDQILYWDTSTFLARNHVHLGSGQENLRNVTTRAFPHLLLMTLNATKSQLIYIKLNANKLR